MRSLILPSSFSFQPLCCTSNNIYNNIGSQPIIAPKRPKPPQLRRFCDNIRLPLEGELRLPAACGRGRKAAISAAVEKCKDQRKPAAFFGHRKAGAVASATDEVSLVVLPPHPPQCAHWGTFPSRGRRKRDA